MSNGQLSATDLAWITLRVQADLAGTSLAKLRLAARPLYGGPSGHDEIEIEVKGENFEHTFPVEAHSAEDGLVNVMSVVQDDAIDQLGRGWPEMYANGEFVNVLVPGLDATEHGCWLSGESAVCRIGELHSLAGGMIRW